MPDVVVIIQARIRSSRLPAKTMLLLPNQLTVIETVISKCADIVGTDAICVAIPIGKDCDLLEKHINSYPGTAREVTVVRGPEDDVLKRFVIASNRLDAKHIMRITSDCPLLNPMVCSEVLRVHLDGGCDYTSNVEKRTYPHGYDCEVFTAALLGEAADATNDAYDREHVTPWMKRNAKTIGSVTQLMDESGIRFVLDTVEDYVSICGVMG